MWDGAIYDTRDDAREALEAYKSDGAEVHMFLEEDKYLVYWRRVASAAPPRLNQTKVMRPASDH
jgi:hypothetical protein